MIILYHNITADHLTPGKHRAPGLRLSCFARQMNWLRRRRRLVGLSDYLDLTEYGRKNVRHLVAITFDDGLASTFSRAYPVLKSLEIPATFFISTSHLDGGNLLWFSYLNSLCFDGSYDHVELKGQKFPLNFKHQRKESRRRLGQMAKCGGDPKAFSDELALTYPLAESSLQEYAGMSPRQLALFANDELLECGAHTVNHPYLDRLSAEAQQAEIITSKQQLEALTGRPIRFFAYPNGDYNQTTLGILERGGFVAAFATDTARVNLKQRFEITRMGIYSTSFSKFWLKACGVAKSNLRRTIKTRWTQKPSRTLVPHSN